MRSKDLTSICARSSSAWGTHSISDEGLGVHALKPLEERLGAQTAVELLDGGTLGLSLLPLVEACDHLLLIDAIDAGQPPGTIVELCGDEIPLYAGIKISQHQLTFQEVLGLARIREQATAQASSDRRAACRSGDRHWHEPRGYGRHAAGRRADCYCSACLGVGNVAYPEA